MRKALMRLHIEPLESRQLLAANITLNSGGQLILHGTHRDDTAVVSTDNNQIVVQLNNLNQNFDASQVQQIMFQGRRGDDSFNNTTDLPSIAWGGRGDDTLIGGSANDEIDGGAGNDNLQGNGGSDQLRGRRGADNLQGGAGQDGAHGGRGNDAIDGGEDNDSIQGDRGKDVIDGGVGDDNIDAGKGRDNVTDDSGVNVVNNGKGINTSSTEMALSSTSDLQVSVEVRFITVSDTFAEQMGVDFDVDISEGQAGDRTELGVIQIDPPKKKFRGDVEVEITEGNNSLGTLRFEGPVSPTAMTVGFAILSDIEAFFFVQAAQGKRRDNILQAPTVTLFNGQSATVNDATARPFVTSIVPTVG